MNDFETNMLAQMNKIERHLDFLVGYMMDISLVFTTLLAKQLDLEKETVDALTREVRSRILDVYLSEEEEDLKNDK